MECIAMNETGFVVVGEIPYRCDIMGAAGLAGDVRCVRLLENIGHEDVMTPDLATTFFRAGTVMLVRWDGDLHPTTGDRCYRVVDPRHAAKGR
jgi:hypothetical protein